MRMAWTVETLNEIVAAELEARLVWISNLIESLGLEKVGLPYVRHLEEKLWEIRITGRDGIARALYVTSTRRRVIILRVFVKKTQKTPRREIELALKRAEEVTDDKD